MNKLFQQKKTGWILIGIGTLSFAIMFILVFIMFITSFQYMDTTPPPQQQTINDIIGNIVNWLFFATFIFVIPGLIIVRRASVKSFQMNTKQPLNTASRYISLVFIVLICFFLFLGYILPALLRLLSQIAGY